MYKPSSKQELLGMIAALIQNTPEEFINFDEVEFDIGSEFTVDGSDVEDYYDGCKVKINPTGQLIIVIPLVRRASVYAYYADQMDADVEEAERTVDDLKRARSVYRALGRSE